MKIATAQTIRELDRRAAEEYGISGAILMENAGGGVARILVERFPEVRETGAVIVAGTGNNGGDGFVVARRLADRGIDVDVFLVGDEAKVKAGEAAANLATLKKMRLPVVPITKDEDAVALLESVRRRAVVVDALLGTGLEREVSGIFARVISIISEGCAVLSVDIPSGISSDTGKVMGTAVSADLTAALALPKIGEVIHPGAEHAGELIVLDISIPRRLVAEVAIADQILSPDCFGDLLSRRPRSAHKGDFGHLLVIAGSAGKTGAAALCGMGALRAGAGLVTIGAPASQVPIIASHAAELMTEPLPDEAGALARDASGRIVGLLGGKTAVALGPGLGTGKGAAETVRRLIEESDLPLVIDADGINVVAADPAILKKKKADVTLTPHPGEMGRLVGKGAREVQDDRIGIARKFAADFGVRLVLKGARTIIAEPAGEVFISTGGNPGMATAGTGDVLTGLIGGFLAASADARASAAGGVFVHAAAADRAARRIGEPSMVAHDLLAEVPGVIDSLGRGSLEPDLIGIPYVY